MSRVAILPGSSSNGVTSGWPGIEQKQYDNYNTSYERGNWSESGHWSDGTQGSRGGGNAQGSVPSYGM